MQNKKVQLLILLLTLFALPGFSQTTDTSAHPLLDKYYPQPKSAEPAPVVTAPANPQPVINPVAETKPQVSPIDTSATIQSTTPLQTAKPVAPIAETEVIAQKTPQVVADTAAIKSTGIVAPMPAKKIVQSKPATKPYNPNRLGSSSPLYDTWEKNNNGAGSVTTGSK